MNQLGDGVGDVEVEVDLGLSVEAGVEIARARRAERRVDSVVEEEVRFVRAVAGAGVPGQAVLRGPAHAGHRRHIGDRPREARGEAARGDLLEVEAVRVGQYLRQGRLVRPVVGNRHRRTARRAVADAVLRVQYVADEQRLPAVEAEDVGAGIGIPVVEPLRRGLLGVVGVAVRLHPVGEQVAEVAEQLQVVVDPRMDRVPRRWIEERQHFEFTAVRAVGLRRSTSIPPALRSAVRYRGNVAEHIPLQTVRPRAGGAESAERHRAALAGAPSQGRGCGHRDGADARWRQSARVPDAERKADIDVDTA